MIHISQAENLQHPDFVSGFFGRTGGVSQGPFESLNVLLRGDESPENVIQNKKRLMAALGFPETPVLFLNQRHTATIVIASRPWDHEAPEGDALITETPGLAIGVMTADCVPLLIMDPVRKIVAAIHGGWRGLLQDIIHKTLAILLTKGASLQNLRASIGPCIHQESYQVSPEVYDSFLSFDPGLQNVFKSDGEKYKLDLVGTARYFLEKEGLMNISVIDYDTYTHPQLFFSCRYVKGQIPFGDQASVIMIRP